MSRVNIDWKAIRPLNGSRARGFEELCAQLARAESPPGSRFERKGAPDAGVECYAVLGDGSEWAWQAKYFDGLSDPQWSQLDDSVRTALQKHPRLVRYFVCIPLDRSDARVDRQRSAKDRWDEHVQKWTRCASMRNMSVEFVYWGSHELLEWLTQTKHVGRVRFWFDVHGFDGAWFQARLEEALSTAGPRYTPEIHVNLPIAAELEAFGRTERLFDRIKAHARNIRKELRSFEYSEPKSVEPTLDGSASALSSKIQEVLTELAAVTVQPIGNLPFQRIADHVADAEACAVEFGDLLLERERAHDAKPPATGANAATSPHSSNPFRERSYYLPKLRAELRETREDLVHSEEVAGRALMLLKGTAGMGKTHLLCDVARQRVAAGRPTVLLMGQWFISADAPWTQALQQLDLPGLSTEEFVGALEAAAQAADHRALLLIDAINEGSGRLIWPSHLAAFLAHLERSPWIGVLLSVRSSYEEIVVPKEVRTRAAVVKHEGFAEHEYDATRTFFVHYGLELPSTPLLAPEFRNPLFLKTLCFGLKEKGERRLPRGFHGVSAVFDLYLSAVNVRLASALGFNPRDALVGRALEAFAKALVDSDKGSLARPTAEDLVNAPLPNREFERSLYRGLVAEGVLVEEIVRLQNSVPEEIVLIAYQRFADHLQTKMLLDAHLDADSPESAFADGAPLSFLWDASRYEPGILEAMCVQIPERTGCELVSLAPKVADHWGIGDAFRQSIVWRAPTAFSHSTFEVLNKLVRNDNDSDDTLDVLLTVATLPGHPLNARFLDQRLRRDAMPERDAWWSTYLHRVWQTHGAVDRLVDWASSVSINAALDDEGVDLCVIALSWMLSTSNRFLRDRATQALVNLLTGRLGAVVRLVERFADVDDPYVAERVYAVAYGTAMRSHNPAEVGALGACVYARVFATGSPPAHILLRDYARGVVERAIHLGATLDIVPERIRPPYQSEWPAIPSEDEIKPLLPDWSRGSYDSGDIEWARNTIASSVMDGDFARYVIGTNSSFTNWLSLRLGDPVWQSPASRLAAIIERFSKEQRSAWEEFENADEKVRQLMFPKQFAALFGPSEGEKTVDAQTHRTGEDQESDDPELARWEHKRDAAFAALESLLTEGQARDLQAAIAAKSNEDARRPPRFDLRLIQRHVLWRVFDLGWTTKRFGHFDRFYGHSRGREASKAERIGKKYQWIAYHEIMALVADHFQYLEEFGPGHGDQAYDGPWQGWFRDIDPSCTLRAVPGGTSWHGHSPAWWGAVRYEKWEDPQDQRTWVSRYDDLPKLEDLLSVVRPDDGSRWLNLQGYFNWQQQPPADREWTEVERREIWYMCTGYLVRSQDADVFLKWAETVDFWGRWMPDPPEVYRMFLGEDAWSPASRYFQQPYFGDEGWTQPGHGCPGKVRPAAFEYLREATTFDCSVDESYALRLPATDLVTGLGLRWSGSGADYLDPAGQLGAFDPTANADGPSALLIREDLLKKFLAHAKLAICWAILGEKRVLGAGFKYYASLRMSGAYMLGNKGPVGFLKCMLDDSKTEQPRSPLTTLAVIRSSG